MYFAKLSSDKRIPFFIRERMSSRNNYLDTPQANQTQSQQYKSQ